MVAKNLTHSLQVVAPGGNHSISMEGCVPKIIAQFIELGAVDGIKTDCAKNIVPLPLVLGANEIKSSSSSQFSASSSQSSATPNTSVGAPSSQESSQVSSKSSSQASSTASLLP
jgi:hypothetical protein